MAALCVARRRQVGIEYELQRSDVVCLRSRPPDGAGLHTGIRSVVAPSAFLVPADAIFTLESVAQPGEWAVPGRRQPSTRRLFTVLVSYA